jgi:hydroxymethylpyrimidine/phosphomethylpyrimidine kinase
VALTIAGSDSGGGAGLQADLKTFAAMGVHGYSAVTGVTAQNSRTIERMVALSAALVAGQIETVAAERRPGAIKTGALFNGGIVRAVARTIERLDLPAPIVDPVLISTSGRPLLDAAGEAALRNRLIPIAALVTPNIPEAERLSGIVIDCEDAIRAAAIAIHRGGARAVLIKGGHPLSAGSRRVGRRGIKRGEVVDLLYDGSRFMRFAARRVSRLDMHGGGCVLSAAIAARMALGDTLAEAVAAARRIMDRVIAGRIRLGEGRDMMGPVVVWPGQRTPSGSRRGAVRKRAPR